MEETLRQMTTMQTGVTDERLDAIKQLVAIPSTADSPAELHKALDFMAQRLVRSGRQITIERFESGGKPSFLAYKGKQRPDNFRIILNGHLDVVPGKPSQYKAFVKDGKLYGRGVYDMKAACIVLADLFTEFVDQTPYPLGLQLVTDEESAGRHGALYQIQQGVRGDFVICGECGRSTSVYEIANESKGMVCVEVAFRGVSSHGAYPWRGDSVAAKVAQFVDALHKRFPIPNEESSDTTITVTNISSSSGAWTKTPDVATVTLDARYIAGDPNFRSKRHFAALLEELDPNAEIVNFHDFSSPLYTSPQNPLLQSLKASAEKIEGAKFTLVRRHATSDGRYYGDVGDQACEFGIAGEHQHADGEYIPLKAFENYYQTMYDFLTKTLLSERENSQTHASKD